MKVVRYAKIGRVVWIFTVCPQIAQGLWWFWAVSTWLDWTIFSRMCFLVYFLLGWATREGDSWEVWKAEEKQHPLCSLHTLLIHWPAFLAGSSGWACDWPIFPWTLLQLLRLQARCVTMSVCVCVCLHNLLNFCPFLQNQANHHFWLLDGQLIKFWNTWEIYVTVPQYTLTLQNYFLWNFLGSTSPGFKFRSLTGFLDLNSINSSLGFKFRFACTSFKIQLLFITTFSYMNFLWRRIQGIELRVCCYCSVAKSCPTVYNPMDYSTPGSSVLHYLLEFAQIHVHWVGDAI